MRGSGCRPRRRRPRRPQVRRAADGWGGRGGPQTSTGPTARGGSISFMTTPINPVPHLVACWMSRVRWLRGLDALVAWTGLWATAVWVLGRASAPEAAVLSMVIVCLSVGVRSLRTRWRPVTGWVGLTMSRSLQVGDRAWYVRAHRADLVLVTARHGARLAIAGPSLAEDESLTVRRTRVLVLPTDSV